MPTTPTSDSVFERLDQLNEFEREPVTADKLQPGRYFAAVYSGEHIAATEFVIGVTFVNLGAGAFDVLVGLVLGNLLAVLSWALVCAPIAVQTRLTLYWYLRKIAGPVVTVVYNLLNGVLHCILAGAMITVSASAIRIPLGIPSETNWYPSNPAFVALVLCVGAVVVTLAIWGFKRLAQFSSLCAPWMVAMFIAGGLIGLPMLAAGAGRPSMHSLADFWRIASGYIWTGETPPGGTSIGFWHIVAFAWICNLATHIGLSDMAMFRFARRASYGYYSAFGMYLGHYLSWICAGIMGAAAAVALETPLVRLDSGAIAHQVLGAMGALTVVLAGWTTANPTLYRAGLAFQVVTPGWPRWLVTLLAGALTTAIACFPFVFTRLLDFVALYGLLLMPVGAIVVVEHWILPRLGWTQFWSSRKGQLVNWPALAAWGAALAAALTMRQTGLLHDFFLAGPVWLLTAAVYLVLAGMAGARDAMPESCDAGVPPAPSVPFISTSQAGGTPALQRPGTMYYVSAAVALACLVLCVVLPLLVFLGRADRQSVNQWLILVTIAYFVSGTLWMNLRGKP